MKGLTVYIIAIAMGMSLSFGSPDLSAADPIIHDGEYYFIKRQHGDKWAEEDKALDAKLAEVRKQNGGKRPNILYVLIDDISFGQMGNRAMNHVTGIRTPNINQLAREGMSLLRMYTEPSCTPTRTAFITGRHPVRTGLKEVKVALVGEGLGKDEVTIAEVLSKAGYNTAHVGKWHLGDIEEAYPHNQGFDFAAFPLHQQVQLSLMTREAALANNLNGWYAKSQSDTFELDRDFRPKGLVTGVEASKGDMAREIDIKAGEEWTIAHYAEMNKRYQRQVLEQIQNLGKKGDPFFIQYWPLWPINFVHDQEENLSLNGGTMAEKLEVIDKWMGEILAEIEKQGIANNTLVVFMADNGIMRHYPPSVTGLNQLIYRGGKTDFTEGGVRVDAFARWPGVIEADSAASDIIHVADLYTTFATIAQADEYIPRDRIVDGLDQTSMLLNGEGHGRRDYVYIYQNEALRAIVKQQYKMHIPAPGMPAAGAAVYDLYRDTREEYPHVGNALWTGASFQDMAMRHMIGIKKYPHAALPQGIPYGGIENLRPESKEAVETFMSWRPKMQ
jgi:arylsulfatase